MFQEPYAKVCTIDDAEKITLFNNRSYKTLIITGLDSSRICNTNILFNRSAWLNLLCVDMVEIDWMSWICICNTTQLGCATNQKIEVISIILLHVRLRDGRVRVVLGIVKILAVPVFLETPFTDKFVKWMFSHERENSPVSLAAGTETECTQGSVDNWTTTRTNNES